VLPYEVPEEDVGVCEPMGDGRRSVGGSAGSPPPGRHRSRFGSTVLWAGRGELGGALGRR